MKSETDQQITDVITEHHNEAVTCAFGAVIQDAYRLLEHKDYDDGIFTISHNGSPENGFWVYMQHHLIFHLEVEAGSAGLFFIAVAFERVKQSRFSKDLLRLVMKHTDNSDARYDFRFGEISEHQDQLIAV